MGSSTYNGFTTKIHLDEASNILYTVGSNIDSGHQVGTVLKMDATTGSLLGTFLITNPSIGIRIVDIDLKSTTKIYLVVH